LVISGAVIYFFHVRNEQNNQVLEIRGSGSGRIYGRWFLEEGSGFAIEFIHSVNQSPVREFFTVEENMIRLQKVRFYTLGAGISDDLEEGQELIREGDALVITGFNRYFSELNFIIGTVSDHLLFINDEVYSLQELCGKNAQITISLRRSQCLVTFKYQARAMLMR